MIPLGMPTLIESPAPAECAALCHALGLSFIELNMNLPQYQPGSVDVAQCVRLAAEYGIYYTIHLDENLNASDFNPYVAEAYKRTAMRESPSALKTRMATCRSSAVRSNCCWKAAYSA